MHILIAPNAFKNSITARVAAEAIRKGLQQSSLQCTTECFPIADGGDGTAALIIQKLEGSHILVDVLDPLGSPIKASFGLIENGRTAVIEMADASGLRLLKREELNPLRATSYGTGQLIKAALDLGVKRILIAMGGSATVDGGTGILAALGVRFLDAEGRELTNLPETLVALESIDLSTIDARIAHCEVFVLCDVDNRLLGPMGASAVFGPQKGASSEAVIKLEAGLSKLNDIVVKQLHVDISAVKFGGAAGGASAGVFACLNGRLVNGIDFFMELTGFDKALEKSDIVITAEGSLDEQTLQGKGPFGVASRAKKKRIPVIGLAGKIALENNEALKEFFTVVLAIGNEPTDIPTALTRTQQNLIRLSENIGEIIHFGSIN